MARPRNPATRQYPDYVYRDQKRAAVYFRPPQGQRITLAPITATVQEVWTAYNALIHKQQAAVESAPNTLAWMMDEYLVSDEFMEKKRKTQVAYLAYANHLKGHQTETGPLGNWPIEALDPPAASKYLKKRVNLKTGEKALSSANHEIAFLSVVFDWAIRNFRGLPIKVNPLKGTLKYNKKGVRGRYITDAEFDAVQNLARYGHGSYVRFAPWLWMTMELQYLCRMRPSEAYTLTRAQAFEMRTEGVFVLRGKGSKNEVTKWSPRLAEVVLAALEAWPEDKYPGPELLRNHKGKAITEQGYKSASQRLIKTALRLQLIQEPFRFHDIKAKGVTDHPTKESGHRSAKMKAVYDRMPGVVEPTR